MMLAIIGVFTLINRQLGGLFDGSLLFFLPLPMVFFSTKYGMKDSWVVFGAMLLLTIVLGTPQSLFYMFGEGLIGVVYGSGIHAKKDSGKLLGITMLIGIAVDLLTMVVFASFFGYNLTAEMSEYKKILANVSEQSGMQLSSMVNVDQFLMEILILSAMMTGILEVLCTHFLSRFMLNRLGFHVEKAKPITAYELPKWSGYLGFAGLAAYYFSVAHPLENDILQMFLQGFGLAAMYFLVIAGMIGIVRILRYRNPNLPKAIGILVFFFGMMMSIWCAIWGFLYLTTDLKDRFLQGGKPYEK